MQATLPRLLLFDLDDTLLHSNKIISDYTTNVLRACQQRGMLVGFATARGESNILPFVEQVKPDIVVSSGGAMIRYHDEIIDTQMFSGEETAAILRSGLQLMSHDCLMTVDTLDAYYGNYAGDATGILTGWGEVTAANFEEFHEPALKICVHLPGDDLAREVAAAVPGCDWLRFSGGQWYKFTKAKVTKESAAARLSDLLGIAPADMMAFGDDYSDIGMLRYCGTGVAVANAISEVIAAADVVVGSQDEDGPAVWLKQTVLRGVL